MSDTDVNAHLSPGAAEGQAVTDSHALSDERWALIRDVAVFQGKLALDWVRDLVLSPVSIGLAAYGLATDNKKPGRHFYRLMSVGRKSDRIIDLFAAGDEKDGNRADERTVDQLVEHLETLVKRQYEKGGITRHAKDAVDQAIDKVQAELDRARGK